MKTELFGVHNEPTAAHKPTHHPGGHHHPHHRPHYGHLPHHKPHHHGHLPPHMRSSMIRVQYDEMAMEKLASVYGEALDFAIDRIERSPPEIKLTLALALGLEVDLSDYRAYLGKPVRFPSPLLTEAAVESFTHILGNDVDVAAQIYDACPPEQTLLAVAVAAMIASNKSE